jgi:hypothetical protein
MLNNEIFVCLRAQKTKQNPKNAVFWDPTPCGFIINRRFGGAPRLHVQGRRNNAIEEECWTVPRRW